MSVRSSKTPYRFLQALNHTMKTFAKASRAQGPHKHPPPPHPPNGPRKFLKTMSCKPRRDGIERVQARKLRASPTPSPKIGCKEIAWTTPPCTSSRLYA